MTANLEYKKNDLTLIVKSGSKVKKSFETTK
jgi:hypothetical protein